MNVKMILPALTEAKSPFFRPIKYSLFPPLGLATLAAYLSYDDDVTIEDEHLARLPARVRLLLQGGVLRRRPVVLHAAGRRRPRRDRAAARTALVLPR